MNGARSAFRNPVTLAGAAIAILAVLFLVSFQLIELMEPTANPYTGLWTFLVLPAFLLLGLLLVPLGWWIERGRRKRAGVEPGAEAPKVDLAEASHRKGLLIFGLGTLGLLPLVGITSYQGYHYTESTQFCGQVCHDVMHPEYTSYLGSPHARVSCAACHIGPGAGWYVKSKLSGVRQIWAATFETFPRPIPTPIQDLRPARETCEQCHWPAKFYGAQLRTRVHFASDEANTRREIRVLVKTGGGDSTNGPASGIHWHMALGNTIEYIATDRARQQIPWVRATDTAGRVTVYRSDGKRASDPAPDGEIRRIDCMDCHNRPTHVLQPPDRAVNISLETGRIDRTLPYVKKAAVEALVAPYGSEGEAERKIGASIREFYQRLDPKVSELRSGSINQAVGEVQSIYRRNFFPRMKVDWRTYPDHIGHMIFDGCYRCHEGRHRSDEGRTIGKDCTVCHEFQQPIVVGGTPSTAFRQGTPDHPIPLEGIHAQLKCSACHTGGRAPQRTCAGCHERQTRFAEGKIPALPGLEPVRASMADVDCDGCHDLTKPLTASAMAPKCEACHEKGYGDMIELWRQDAVAGRAKAAAALEEMRRAAGNGTRAGRSDLLGQLETALTEIDRAGALHNTQMAETVYQHIVKSTAQSSNTK